MISSKTKKSLNNTGAHHTGAHHTGAHHTGAHHTGAHHTAPHHTAPHHIMTHHVHDTHNVEGSILGKVLHFTLGAFAVLAFVLAIMAIGGYINYNDVPISAIDGKLIQNSSTVDNSTTIVYDQDFEISTKSTSADLLIENNGNRINMGKDLQIASNSSTSQITLDTDGVKLSSDLDMGGKNISSVNNIEASTLSVKYLGNLDKSEVSANTFTLNRITTPPTGTGIVGNVRLMLVEGASTFTGSINNGTLSVTSTSVNPVNSIVLGMTISGPGVLSDTIITSVNSGTYTVMPTQTVATSTSPVSMTGYSTNRLYVNSASNVWNYINLSTIDNTRLTRGPGFIPGTPNINNIFNSSIERIGDIVKTTIVFTLNGLVSSSTNNTQKSIGGSTGAANSYLCYLERGKVGTIKALELKCIEAPSTGVGEFVIYSSTVGAQQQGISLTSTEPIVTSGKETTPPEIGDTTYFNNNISSNILSDVYLYVTCRSDSSDSSGVEVTFETGTFVLTCYGY